MSMILFVHWLGPRTARNGDFWSMSVSLKWKNIWENRLVPQDKNPAYRRHLTSAESSTRQLTENIPIWAYYPLLVILFLQLGIIYPIGDWRLLSQVKQSQRTNYQSPIISNITYWGFEIPNRSYYTQSGIFTVSPLLIQKKSGVTCRVSAVTWH